MKKYLLLLFLSCSITTFAQQADSISNPNRVFRLGEVQVTGSPIDSVNSVSYKKIEKFNRTDVAGALNLLSGVSIGNVGPRSESVVYIRGFDLRQLPLFVDGVPVYVPYDGYVDLARFTTFDLAEINVAKGFSSVLYGANTMGGAINLVSRKPLKKFELMTRAGAFSGEGFRWNINVGSRMEKFYVQAGLSQLRQETYPLSADFESRKLQRTEDRENAYRDDRKMNVKIGFIPNDRHEFAIGVTNQDGKKGTPPYVGNDPAVRARFWQWPKWNKKSVYFISNSQVGENSRISTRLYQDTFVNELFSFDDTTYTVKSRPYAFESYYNDYTTGGNVQFETRFMDDQVLKIAVQAKQDVHRENNLNEPVRKFVDNTLSVALENIWKISSVTIIPGISYNKRGSSKAQDFNATTHEITDFDDSNNDAINAQVGFVWDVSESHIMKASVARKTRFATIKDRYSYRMGQAIPNPYLSAESSVNYDLSYTANFFNKLTANVSTFRSDIDDIIQQVDNVEPGRFQLQNAGKALFYGLEAGVDYRVVKNLAMGVNYSYLRRKNISKPELYFTSVPNHKTFAYADLTFLKRANLLLSLEYNSQRYSTSYGMRTGGYTLLNIKTSVALIKNLQLEGGVNNAGDKNYVLVEGFPEAGRNYFVNLVFSNL